MNRSTALDERVATFVRDVVEAMGLELEVQVTQTDDHVRIDLDGDGGSVLLRRKGEALDALQYVINSVFRHETDGGQRLVVDHQDFRRGKDREVQQMTRFLIDRVRSTGAAQEIGPLNSYARRLVHLEVATHGDVESESQGDGAVKTVIISLKNPPRGR